MAEARIGSDIKGIFGLAAFLTITASVIGEPMIGWLVAPIVILALIYCACSVPLRYSLFVLMFCALVLENPSEGPAYGQWKSPFYMVGAILLTHLNNTLGIPGLSFSGMDLCLAVLLLLAAYRKFTGSKVDQNGRIATPEPLVKLGYLSLGGIAYVTISGMLRGGNFSMSLWQIDRVIYLPVVFFLFHMGLRGPKDFPTLARIVVTAACVKACMAVYVINTVFLPPDELGNTKLPYATTHHDSMLFAAAFVLLVALMVERVGRKATRTALMLLPTLTIGMISNNRRMVWVQVFMVFTTLYFATPENAIKRKIKRVFYVLSPIIAIYIAVGWEAKGGIFKPVETIRSIVDSKSDSSTEWRDTENYNIIYTIKQFPLLGVGYGNPYWEVIPLPAIAYALEQYCPHNSILGLFCYCGFFGFTAITLQWAAAVFFGMRAYHAAKKPPDRVAALMSFGAVMIYLIQCYGDMGLGSWIGVYTVAPAIVSAGKVAVALGAWPSKTSKKDAGANAPAGSEKPPARVSARTGPRAGARVRAV